MIGKGAQKISNRWNWNGRFFQSLEVATGVVLLSCFVAAGQGMPRVIRMADGQVQVITQAGSQSAQDSQDSAVEEGSAKDAKLQTSENPFATNKFSTSDAQQLVQRALSMDYQRTAQSFYRVMDERRQSGRSGPGESFASAVILGDWPKVGRLLSRVSADDGKKVYSKMLSGLARQAKAQQGYFKRYESAQPQLEAQSQMDDREVQQAYYSYRSGGDSISGIFLSDDFFGVVEAAPCALGAEDLMSLVALGKVALAGEQGQRMLADRLKAGLKGFRENDPAEAMNAAKLLCALGWPSLAEPYMPATAREVKDSSAADTLLASDFFAARGDAEKDEKARERAWRLLGQAAVKGAPVADVVQRVCNQAAELDDSFVREALPALLTNCPALAQPLLAYVAKSASSSSSSSPQSSNGDGNDDEEDGYAKALRVQALLIEGLIAASDEVKHRPELMSGLVWNWLTAAEHTRTTTEGEISQRAREAMYGQRSVYRNRNGSLSAQEALDAAPGEGLIDALGSGLGRQVRLMKFALQLLCFKDAPALEYLKICCAKYPQDGRELCGNYLAAWVDKRCSALAKEDPEYARLRAQGYMAQQVQMAQRSMSGGIPLTRARQNKNVADLKSLLIELRKVTPQLDPARVTWAFINIHSDAEVFRIEDVQGVFGEPEKMERAELRTIVGAMRVNLAKRWRDMEVQQKAATNRSEQDVKDEVSRGYRVALELVKRGMSGGASWEDRILRGQLFFDASEFEHERGIKLADYVNLRDDAFASYKLAAAKYGESIAARPRNQWTIAPYQAWFFVLLGASDLSALTPGQARNDLGLRALHDALAGLPGDAATVHTTLFAASLTNLLERVPSQMRQKFLMAGVQVVGETHPAAAPARDILAYYANLTDEAQLRVTIDGPTRVGHNQPFGIFINLDHTRQLAREGGGFAKYLQNQAAQMASAYGGYMPPGQRAAVDYRDNFQTNFNAALGAQFEIQSLVFHDPSVKPIDLPRDGWQTMPLAYAVLKARDPAVDHIPSIQLDMDFADQKGVVVLPVLSQVVPISASEEKIIPRPCSTLAISMILDKREWRSTGKAAIEISATGDGIIPPFKDLFTGADSAFETETKDAGLIINSVQTEKGTTRPQTTRIWQLACFAPKAGVAPAAIHFPAVSAAFTNAKVTCKQYVDADLETIDPRTALAGIALPAGARAATTTTLLIVVLAAAMLAFAIFMRRWGRPVARPASKIEPPHGDSPFAIIAFLRRLHNDRAAALSETDRAALQQDIHAIETACFGPNPAPASAPTPADVARRWLAKV